MKGEFNGTFQQIMSLQGKNLNIFKAICQIIYQRKFQKTFRKPPVRPLLLLLAVRTMVEHHGK